MPNAIMATAAINEVTVIRFIMLSDAPTGGALSNSPWPRTGTSPARSIHRPGFGKSGRRFGPDSCRPVPFPNRAALPNRLVLDATLAPRRDKADWSADRCELLNQLHYFHNERFTSPGKR